MLGKQWLNRYESTDLRGTAVERSQNRQRKLDGIVAWYFDPVMELLPLMLQVALLLLGCALSRYLWGIDTTVASVVLGVTSSGVFLYIFIVVAGAASESCPYQTPGSHALRHLGPKIQNALHSAASAVVSAFRGTPGGSKTVNTIKANVQYHRPWWSRGKIGRFFRDMILGVPRALAIDVYRLGRAMVRPLVTFSSTTVGLLTGFAHRMHDWLYGTSSPPGRGSDHQTTILDFRCISWMIQTSLDKAVHLSTLKHLATMAALTHSNPTLVADCFSILIGCINIDNRKVAIIPGLEQLATLSATCFLRTFHHLSVTDPTSSILADVRRRYRRIFPFEENFTGLPFCHTVARILVLDSRHWNPHYIQWGNYRPSAQEQIVVARGIAEAAQVEYYETRHRKVPRWILYFALRSLSLDPPPPASIIAGYLSTIAISLGCDVSNTGATTLNERCVRVPYMSITLTSN